MKFYVEAYYHDGSIILGNLDGQCIIHAKEYKRTKMYKHLRDDKFRSVVKFHKIFNAYSNKLVETIEHV